MLNCPLSRRADASGVTASWVASADSQDRSPASVLVPGSTSHSEDAAPECELRVLAASRQTAEPKGALLLDGVALRAAVPLAVDWTALSSPAHGEKKRRRRRSVRGAPDRERLQRIWEYSIVVRSDGPRADAATEPYFSCVSTHRCGLCACGRA
jgi:hypothetical protein